MEPKKRADEQPGPIADLAALQKEHGLADDAFALQVSLGYSGSSWGKIKAGNFPGNPDKALRAVRKALAGAQGGLDPSQGRYVVFEHIQGVLDGVAMAEAEGDESPNRGVIFVAGMGMGKTALAKHLRQQQQATVIDGQPSWGSSYMAALRDIATGLGIVERFGGKHDGEKLILDELKAAPRLLVIDEANYFTTDGLNFVKTILNKTQSVVVLCTLPEDYARWKAANRHETRQLIRRSQAIVRAPAISERDVRSVVAAGWPSIHVNGAAPKIAKAANKFGGLDLVVRVLKEVDPADADDAPGALTRVLESIEEGGAA